MHVIFILIVLFASVNGNCNFQSSDSKKFEEKMKEQGIYERIFTLTSNTSTYSIGICKLPDNPRDDGAVIQQEKNLTYVLGQLNHANLIGGDDWMLLTYENGTTYNNTCGNKTRSVSIIFVCGKNTDTYRVLQEHANGDNNCNYVFEFQGYGMCPRLTPSKKNLSGGAIFLIILLCIASVYLIGGFFYMRIIRGARGIDQIPNLELWYRLGHLAADGCDYCCRCNRNIPRPGYYTDESGPDLRGDDDILAP